MIILRKQVTVAQLILCSLCISCSANSLFIVTGGKKLLMHVQQALPRTIKEIVSIEITQQMKGANFMQNILY